jgi:triacylglycerol lipase
MPSRSRALSWAVPAAALALVAAVLGGSPAEAAGRLPVPYTFLPNAVIAGATPYANPPGANDWTCRPSAAHPEPVVLVHGTGGNKNTNLQTYAPLLANNGYCVFALTYGLYPGDQLPVDQVGARAPIEQSAAELRTFVNRVLAATGAAKVDIVGHSQGTVVPDYYAKFLGGAHNIDKYVSLASLWHGTNTLGSAQLEEAGRAYGFDPVSPIIAQHCGACLEMMTGSPFMTKLRAGGVKVPGITYTNIVTKYDELVVPYTSGIEAGMHNIVVQNQCKIDFTEHVEIAADPVAAADVLNALDPAHPRPVPCRLVLPAI